MLEFGLLEGLLGRRSRRFFMGAEIRIGVFAYKSKHAAVPLSEIEKLHVVSACGEGTSWHHMIHRALCYAPHISNYAGAAGGRTLSSAAGFHTSVTFYTDDDGVYILGNRDAPVPAERESDGSLDIVGPGGRIPETHKKDKARPSRSPSGSPLYRAAQYLFLCNDEIVACCIY